MRWERGLGCRRFRGGRLGSRWRGRGRRSGRRERRRRGRWEAFGRVLLAGGVACDSRFLCQCSREFSGEQGEVVEGEPPAAPASRSISAQHLPPRLLPTLPPAAPRSFVRVWSPVPAASSRETEVEKVNERPTTQSSLSLLPPPASTIPHQFNPKNLQAPIAAFTMACVVFLCPFSLPPPFKSSCWV